MLTQYTPRVTAFTWLTSCFLFCCKSLTQMIRKTGIKKKDSKSPCSDFCFLHHSHSCSYEYHQISVVEVPAGKLGKNCAELAMEQYNLNGIYVYTVVSLRGTPTQISLYKRHSARQIEDASEKF